MATTKKMPIVAFFSRRHLTDLIKLITFALLKIAKGGKN